MEKPYIIEIHNPEEEFKSLKVKFDIQNPLAFLDNVIVGLTESGNGKIASNVTTFDITPQLEFTIYDDSVIDKVSDALNEFGFIITIKDATNDLLHDKIDYSNASEFTRYCIYKYYLERFDSDDILDKISLVGIDALNDFDRHIIKKP